MKNTQYPNTFNYQDGGSTFEGHLQDLPSEPGDPYEYKYDHKKGVYLTRYKGRHTNRPTYGEWIEVDPSKYKKPFEAIEQRYGNLVNRQKEDLGTYNLSDYSGAANYIEKPERIRSITEGKTVIAPEKIGSPLVKERPPVAAPDIDRSALYDEDILMALARLFGAKVTKPSKKMQDGGDPMMQGEDPTATNTSGGVEEIAQQLGQYVMETMQEHPSAEQVAGMLVEALVQALPFEQVLPALAEVGVPEEFVNELGEAYMSALEYTTGGTEGPEYVEQQEMPVSRNGGRINKYFNGGSVFSKDLVAVAILIKEDGSYKVISEK